MPTNTNHHNKDQLIPPREEQPRHHSFTDSATLTVGATGAVVAADELLKMTDEEDNKTASLLKAGVAAAVAVGAYELLKRAEEKGEPIYQSFSRSRSRSRSRSPTRHRSRSYSNASHASHSSQVPHHKRHVLEEVIGAYSLGREILGDRKHHVAHLLGEALGATGLIQELRARDKLDEEERPKR
ncbi:hypothetical protein L207DRAFT_512452 [Hyaloscypha variabilis F]|uniref:Uncharacterized protein n=1 Tax=Hyaloscypha variabilis (strain UAMH 11265 / GT02V1 / F) TaxID=1149755 RepID=A0A2J6RLH1_HYAVF|nr:hypothetical protein L207DRAFT_512452 [Hyaloscypha variabilis F]